MPRHITRDDLGFVSVKEFGAVGNGVADDTDKIQNCIDFAFANKLGVHFNSGEFLVTKPLKLPVTLTITGTNENHLVYTATTNRKCVIKTTSTSVFEPVNTSDTLLIIQISGIYFKNAYTPQVDTVLFKNFEIRGSLITNIVTDNYGLIFSGSVRGVTLIRNNKFVGIWKAFNDGIFVDSYIEDNYINGRPLTNATCFNLAGFTMTTISNNFIDFFKRAFDFTVITEGVSIVNNKIDVCYRGITSTTALNISGAIISNNTFRYMQKSTSIGFFTNPDDEMLNNEWVAIDLLKGGSYVTIQNNIFNKIDTGIKVRSYPNRHLKSRGNVYTSTTNPIDYEVIKSGNTGDQTNIFIEELNLQEFTTLPNATLTSTNTAVPIKTFNNQEAIYSNKRIYNNNGTWRDFLGVVVS